LSLFAECGTAFIITSNNSFKDANKELYFVGNGIHTKRKKRKVKNKTISSSALKTTINNSYIMKLKIT